MVHRPPRLSYANLVSTLALIIALGGTTAFAAGQLEPKSVGEPQLRPGAVTTQKIRKNAVTSPRIKALAVKQGKLANGSVSAAKIAAAAIGTGAIGSGVVTTEKIAADAVTGDKVVESTLGQVPSASKAGSAVVADSADPVAFAAIDAEAMTPRFSGSGAVTAYARIGGTEDCPAPQVEVQTFDAGTRVKQPFYAVFYR